MTIRNLESAFEAKSVALVGASKEPGSLGAVRAHNLFNFSFDGPIMPVNPRHSAVEGVLTYADAAALPVVPDLAVIATPPKTVPGLIAAFAERGTKAAVVITAGFGEHDADGPALRQAMLDAAKPHTMRIVGPNCLGVMVPGIGLNASFARRARANSPSSRSREPCSPRCSIGRRRDGSGSPTSSRWATCAMSISVTCSTTWRPRSRCGPCCSTSNR